MSLIFLVALSWLGLCNSLSLPQDPTYVAGVVEYSKTYLDDSTQERQVNLEDYVELALSADDIDILVFPEATLNNHATAEFVPEPEDDVNPCLAGLGPILSQLSCVARQKQMYIVVNLYEQSYCPDRQQIRFNDTRPCPGNGLNIYNTNVVFDSRGRLMAKYRKYNLYGEAGVIQPLYPESVPFDTSFGVKFALMICFDILFEKPVIDLVNQGVTNFIIPKMWFSKAPFLNAAQIHQGWAWGNNVNLLAAGASMPAVGSTGTGIYHGKFGAITTVMNYLPENRIYRAEVPKSMDVAPKYEPIHSNKPGDMLNLYLKRDNSTPFVTELIPKETFGYIRRDLCMGGSCCRFEIDFRFVGNNDTYEYRMVAYRGLRTDSMPAVPKREAVEVCAIVACADETVESCALRYENVETGFYFRSIVISTQLPRNDHILVMPTTASLSIMPYPVSDFRVTEDANRKVTVELLEPKLDIYAFGMYSRNFDMDA